MKQHSSRELGFMPEFDVSKSVVIRHPEKNAPGYWVGAPSALVLGNSIYLTYRIRRPRGEGRGVINRIAISDDGISFRDEFEIEKSALGNSPSIERSCLVPIASGFRLYFSYVNPATNVWQIDMMEAPSVKSFDTASRKNVLTADAAGASGVKDPYIVTMGNFYLMYVSYAPLPQTAVSGLHATADAFATGLTTSNSGLAISADGVNFRWAGEVIGLGKGWDSSTTRISSVARTPWGFVSFYDGSASMEENYEERCGIAITSDLKHFLRLSTEAPSLLGEGGRSVRYVDPVMLGGKLIYYFETTRADGSHELRAQPCDVES